jgi:hypothetical protein
LVIGGIEGNYRETAYTQVIKMKFTTEKNYIGAIAISILCICVSGVAAMAMNQQESLDFGKKLEKKVKAKPQNTKSTQLWQKQEITKFKALMEEDIQTTLGLSGLGKLPEPPKLPVDLKSYRTTWSKVNPGVTPFLGFWVNDWEMFQPHFAIAIFPSTIKGQICLIEYQEDGSDTPPPGETAPPNPSPRLSTAKIVNGQITTSNLQSHKSLIVQKGDMEFLGTVKGKQEVKIYAAKAIPKLNPQLSPQILQQFKTHKCST